MCLLIFQIRPMYISYVSSTIGPRNSVEDLQAGLIMTSDQDKGKIRKHGEEQN